MGPFRVLHTGPGYWKAATWATSLWFIPQLVAVSAAMVALYSDRNDPPPGCYAVIAACGLLIALALCCSGSATTRGVGLGVLTAAALLLAVPFLRWLFWALPLLAIAGVVVAVDGESEPARYSRISYAGCAVGMLVNAVPLVATAYGVLVLYALVLAVEILLVIGLLAVKGKPREFGVGVAISWLGLGAALVLVLPLWSHAR